MSNIELEISSEEDLGIASSLNAIKSGIESKLSAEKLTPHFEGIINQIGVYYDSGDYIKTIRYLRALIDAGLPFLSVLPYQHGLDSSSFTDPEKQITYTLLHAMNDAARLYITLADKPEHSANAQKLREEASLLLHHEGESAMKIGLRDFDEVITLKAVGNEKKLILENCLREYYQDKDDDPEKDRARKTGASKKIFHQINLMDAIVKWARSVNSSPVRIDNSHIKSFSVTAKDKVRYPEGSYDISLKYVANFLNHIAAFRIHYAEMTMDQNEIESVRQITIARKELNDASDYYLRFLSKKKVPVEELNLRSLAIHGNLAYTYILELYANPDFETLTLSRIQEDEVKIHDHFIKAFFETYNKSGKEIQDGLKVETYARLALAVGISLLTRTNTSPTFNFETGIYDVEHGIINGILVFLDDQSLSKEFGRSGINRSNLEKLGAGIIKAATKTVASQTLKGTPPSIENMAALQHAIMQYQKNGWLSGINSAQ